MDFSLIFNVTLQFLLCSSIIITFVSIIWILSLFIWFLQLLGFFVLLFDSIFSTVYFFILIFYFHYYWYFYYLHCISGMVKIIFVVWSLLYNTQAIARHHILNWYLLKINCYPSLLYTRESKLFVALNRRQHLQHKSMLPVKLIKCRNIFVMINGGSPCSDLAKLFQAWGSCFPWV